MPGPYCTLLLARLGATVVKIEDPHSGDPLRRMSLSGEEGDAFRLLNRGKESVAIDLKQPEGRAIAQALAGRCDIFVEGFRPGVAKRLGIDFDSLKAQNERLIYCSISGYGQDGPYRDLPGHDLTYAAMSGLVDALFPGAPRVPAVPLVDAGAALVAAIRILAALRTRSDGPQLLDVSLYQGARALMPFAQIYRTKDKADEPALFRTLRGDERNDVYRCGDGSWIAVAPMEESFWEALHATLRKEHLLQPGQVASSDDLHAIFRSRSRDEWFQLLSAAAIPCAPLRTIEEALEDDPVSVPADLQAHEHAPVLGEHTRSWLLALGYANDEVGELAQRQIVRMADG